MLEGNGQPVPSAGAHRRLLAHAQPARSGAEAVVLTPRPVRHHSPLAAEGRRARHRDGNPHQGRTAIQLSLSGQLDAARRTRRQAAA